MHWGLCDCMKGFILHEKCIFVFIFLTPYTYSTWFLISDFFLGFASHDNEIFTFLDIVLGWVAVCQEPVYQAIIIIVNCHEVTTDQTPVCRCVHTSGWLRQQLGWPSSLYWLGVWCQTVTVTFPRRFWLLSGLPASKCYDLLQDAPSL